MDDYNVQILFLHNLTPENEAVTIQNFNSFKNNNTDIIGLCDEDQKGLDGSFFVPLNSYVPRGSRRWSPETVILNYALINKDNLIHSHYMFCEYDCYTECNINELCSEYKDYDVVAPHIVYYKDEQNWQWFQGIGNKISEDKLIGFRPSVFILFKKEALIKLALTYIKFWKYIENLNSEVRLGLLSKYLKFNIGEFKNLKTNVNWFETKFIRNYKIYHPVKKDFKEYECVNFKKIDKKSDKIGKWYFGRLGEHDFLGVVDLKDDNSIAKYNNFNEKFWEENGQEILFYNGDGGLTTCFKKIKDSIYHGDFFNGDLKDPKIQKHNAHLLVKIKD